MDHKMYFLFLLLRFILVFLPQTGYIHPDEFFQSTEIVAGDVFRLNVRTTWEFITTFQIRSMAVLGPFVRLPLMVYHHLLTSYPATVPFVTHFLIVLPRFATTVFSLANDLFIFMLCRRLRIPSGLPLFLYSTSHMALIFSSRTLSNTWETAFTSCFCILGLVTTRPISWPLTRMLAYSIQGGILTISVFCRPTSVFFMFPAYCLMATNIVGRFWKTFSSVFIALGAALVAIVCIDYDTYYYTGRQATTADFETIYKSILAMVTTFNLGALRQGISPSIVVTPINFFLYNSNSSNLAEHGHHVWYTHFVMNLLQLLGPFYVFGLISPFMLSSKSPTHTQRSPKRIAMGLLSSCLFPVFCLSFFCHQEARFLLPIIPTWFILCSMAILNLSPPTSSNKAITWSGPSLMSRVLVFWLIFNLFLIAVWGFFHQGGIVQLLPRLASRASPSSRRPDASFTECNAFVFYRTYMPPESLLGRPRVTYSRAERAKSDRPLPPLLPAICGRVVDMAGATEELWRDNVALLRRELLESELPATVTSRNMFLVYPASGRPQNVDVQIFGKSSLYMKVVGHVSSEYPPDVYPYAWPDIKTVWENWMDQISLLCYQISLA